MKGTATITMPQRNYAPFVNIGKYAFAGNTFDNDI